MGTCRNFSKSTLLPTSKQGTYRTCLRKSVLVASSLVSCRRLMASSKVSARSMANTKMKPSRLFFQRQSSVTKSSWPKSRCVHACRIRDRNHEFLVVEVGRAREVALQRGIVVLREFLLDEAACDVGLAHHRWSLRLARSYQNGESILLRAQQFVHTSNSYYR